MGKIISVANQKGGVGKTTTTVNLSTILAKKGKKVLLIDTDPQGNATSGLGVSKDVELSVYDILIGDTEFDETLQETAIKNLKVCPSNISLAGAEVQLVSMMSREQRLKTKLDKIKDQYDYILIDCPPSLGLVTLNAFTASDSVLIPVQCEYFALEGLGQLLNTVNLVKKHLNKNLEIEGALLTMYDARTNLSNQVVKEVKKYFEDNDYFGKKDSIIIFNQDDVPLFDVKERKILIDENKILMASCGHGNVFKAMRENNIFKDLQNRGIKWLLITGIDNILMKPVDFFSLGLIIKRDSSSIGKSICKLTPEEKMGVFCKNNNMIDVMEYSEIDEMISKARDKKGNLIYNDAHLLWNIYDVDRARKIANKNVPYHKALKNISMNLDIGNVYKLESFIFDYFRYFNDMIILRVNRNEEFAPIKNKSGIDSPETAYKLYASYYNGIEKK